MRFTPTPTPNPVLTHGQARVVKDCRPAPGDKPETVAREVTKPRPKFVDPIAKVPDATLAFMLEQAGNPQPAAAARKAFPKWLAAQPDGAGDWRIAFRAFALAGRPSPPPQKPQPQPPDAPVAHVGREIAEAFGMTNMPNVVVVDAPPPAPAANRWLARLRHRQAA